MPRERREKKREENETHNEIRIFGIIKRDFDEVNLTRKTTRLTSAEMIFDASFLRRNSGRNRRQRALPTCSLLILVIFGGNIEYCRQCSRSHFNYDRRAASACEAVSRSRRRSRWSTSSGLLRVGHGRGRVGRPCCKNRRRSSPRPSSNSRPDPRLSFATPRSFCCGKRAD